MHTGLRLTLKRQFLTGVSLITWLSSERQTCLRSSGALCRHGGACTCLPRVPRAPHSGVHTGYRWLAAQLLAQAGRDTGGSQIGLS